MLVWCGTMGSSGLTIEQKRKTVQPMSFMGLIEWLNARCQRPESPVPRGRVVRRGQYMVGASLFIPVAGEWPSTLLRDFPP